MSFIKNRNQWRQMPPYRVETFDQDNFFGKHCVWAAIPGWDWFYSLQTAGDFGGIHTVGQKMFMATNSPQAGSEELTQVARNYGYGIGKAKASLHFSDSNTSGDALRFLRTDADLGIIFPDPKNLTILTICKPIGDGKGASTSDPRVFSKDEGTAANDHDLMIGITGTSARTRIRNDGSSTQTVLAGTGNGGIQADSLNLIAGIVEQTSASAVSIHCWHVREDGKIADALTNVTGEYTPRTTTDMAIGGNAGAADNKFHGEIIGVWAFDKALNDGALLTEFFHNPWQVFQPQTQRIPISYAAPTGFQTAWAHNSNSIIYGGTL